MNVVKDLAYGPHGERNRLDLYRPERTSTKSPLVVCIHGGGWAGGEKERFAWIAADLAGRGFAAASITYRFWPEWRCPAAIEDAHRAVRWLRKNAGRFGLDADRVGAIGGSAGAHLAACLALQVGADLRVRPSSPHAEEGPHAGGPLQDSRVACVVDCYGPVDFPAMMTSASAIIVEGFMGMPYGPETDAAYRAASPIYFVTATPPPFLIVHGTADIGVEKGQVPLTISERFAERLRAAGGDATLLRLEGAPHGFLNDADNPHARAAWAAAAPFFEKRLRGR